MFPTSLRHLLRCPFEFLVNQVLVDLEETLGPVPELQQQAFEAVSEVYGSTRTILASLEPELLSKVKCKVGGGVVVVRAHWGVVYARYGVARVNPNPEGLANAP